MKQDAKQKDSILKIGRRSGGWNASNQSRLWLPHRKCKNSKRPRSQPLLGIGAFQILGYCPFTVTSSSNDTSRCCDYYSCCGYGGSYTSQTPSYEKAYSGTSAFWVATIVPDAPTVGAPPVLEVLLPKVFAFDHRVKRFSRALHYVSEYFAYEVPSQNSGTCRQFLELLGAN